MEIYSRSSFGMLLSTQSPLKSLRSQWRLPTMKLILRGKQSTEPASSDSRATPTATRRRRPAARPTTARIPGPALTYPRRSFAGPRRSASSRAPSSATRRTVSATSASTARSRCRWPGRSSNPRSRTARPIRQSTVRARTSVQGASHGGLRRLQWCDVPLLAQCVASTCHSKPLANSRSVTWARRFTVTVSESPGTTFENSSVASLSTGPSGSPSATSE